MGQWTQRVTIARVKVVPVSPLFQPLSFDNEWKFHRLKNFSSIPSSERERKSCDFIFIINTLLEIITISGKFNARTFAQKEKMILLTNIRISNSTNEIQANVYFTRSHILSLNFPPSPKIPSKISHDYITSVRTKDSIDVIELIQVDAKTVGATWKKKSNF